MSTPPPPPPPPPPPGYQPFGQGGGMGISHSKATAALVCGVLGLLCFAPLGIVAIVLGAQARNDIDRSPGMYKNRGMAQAGFIVGIVAVALWALVLFAQFS